MEPLDKSVCPAPTTIVPEVSPATFNVAPAFTVTTLEAAMLFDPFDTNSLVEALQRLLSDPEYRATLSLRGLQRANEFSWKTTARLTLEVYERAAQAKA